MADINDGTVAGSFQFLTYATRNGYLNRDTGSSLGTGVKKVLQTVEGLEGADLRSMDVDDVMTRFRMLSRGRDVRQETINEYERRFRQVRSDYLKFLDGDDSWKRARTPAGGSKAEKGAVGKRVPSGKTREGAITAAAPDAVSPFTGAASPDLITHTVPLRAGRAQLILPEKYTEQDAERICNVVKALAFKEQLALPPGSNSAA